MYTVGLRPRLRSGAPMGLEELNESCGQNLGKNFGVPDIKRILDINYNNVLLHIPHQLLGGHLHFVEGKPLLAEVFQGGSDVVDGVIDAKEAVVDFVEGLHLDRLILGVVLREVEGELLCDALGVDGGSYISFADVTLARQNERVPFALALRNVGLAFIEHRQHGIINIVVKKDDALFRRAD